MSYKVKLQKKELTQELSSQFSNLSIAKKGTVSSVKLKSKLACQYELFDATFRDIEAKINSFHLNEKNKDEIYKILQSIVDNFSQLILVALDITTDDKYMQTIKTKIALVKKHVLDKCNQFNTTYKRNKMLQESDNYVEPIEKAVGLKWYSKLNPQTNLPDHTIKQLTFQYIPILKTLQCLFTQRNFKQEYFEFNSNGKHVCRDGIYKHSCCSDLYKNSEIFKDKTTIKIRVALDDCEMCDPIKSKSGRHKLTCFYFTINNLPEKYLSKTDNLFLVALCETTNLKIHDNTFDEISELILNEMKQLETVGINVDGKWIKGGLARVISDNLGANGALGFVESFNSFYCRLCEASKEETQLLKNERLDLMRRKESYEICVEAAKNYVESGKPIDFKITKGVKRMCIFNSLRSFHVLDNITLDVMHDVNEGLIPFFLTKFFEYCDMKKIIKKTEIQRLVRDHIYGIQHTDRRPSIVNFDRSNLGQNATQLYFIMLHLPFIFADYRTKLNDIWGSAESLLKIMQIVYSHTISEEDIINLTSYIEEHYTFLIEVFKATLLPKHHHVLHYPNAIRKIGPLIKYWMMRFEAKHRFFTTEAERTSCFVNIAKTLAKKHQAQLSYKTFATDAIKFSSTGLILNKSSGYDEYCQQLSKFIEPKFHHISKVLKFAEYNCFQYKEGFMIISNDKLFEIIHVIKLENQISFFCRPYRVKQFDSYYNSLEIEPETNNISDFVVLELSHLQNPKSYERQISNNKSFVICDCLEFKNLCK